LLLVSPKKQVYNPFEGDILPARSYCRGKEFGKNLVRGNFPNCPIKCLSVFYETNLLFARYINWKSNLSLLRESPDWIPLEQFACLNILFPFNLDGLVIIIHQLKSWGL
jgi:hypothetical protein